jgi:large subunit ribosomal protein L17
MPSNRILNRPSAQRLAILRGLVTSLIRDGQVTTTEARAKEAQSIAEKLIALAAKEADNFTSKQVRVTARKVDSKGRALTKRKQSKNGRVYFVVEKEEKTEMRTVDSPSRLHARRQVISWIYRAKDENGKPLNLVNKLFDEIAPKFKGVSGGYTRIYKLGPRRGDCSELALLKIIEK